MDYDKWVAVGERMGFSGSELSDYVDRKEEYSEREERMLSREEESQRRDVERRHHDDEQRSERLKEEHALKQEERALKEEERALKEEERAMKQQELEMLKIKAEAGALAADKGTDHQSSKTLRPRVPKFEVSKDNMDAYLERFERFAKSQGWKEETWAVSLSSLLTGKGLDVYTSMPPDQANDYTALKKAVLKRYQLTEGSYEERQKDRHGVQDSTPKDWRKKDQEHKDRQYDDRKVSASCIAVSLDDKKVKVNIEDGRLKLRDGESVSSFSKDTETKQDELYVERLEKAQKEDSTLGKLWTYASDKKKMKTKSGFTFLCEVKKDVLYRTFEEKEGSIIKLISERGLCL
ncbi:trichohyalin-like [Mercenaria mercenaria]|uniref:trichohyalin-like n=1 Tax=Mercenaria mercenaria TaxID=6596 RepID=UPI00234F9B30|nr:trichohyalin-like [Mercenaria mercenaria]